MRANRKTEVHGLYEPRRTNERDRVQDHEHRDAADDLHPKGDER
jgi:hypothetical protein